MAEATLEERVATLEQLVARLLRTTAQGECPKDWRRTVGMFDGDPIMQEIIAEGRRLREEDRRQMRP
jgi:hypothetical protein